MKASYLDRNLSETSDLTFKRLLNHSVIFVFKYAFALFGLRQACSSHWEVPSTPVPPQSNSPLDDVSKQIAQLVSNLIRVSKQISQLLIYSGCRTRLPVLFLVFLRLRSQYFMGSNAPSLRLDAHYTILGLENCQTYFTANSGSFT